MPRLWYSRIGGTLRLQMDRTLKSSSDRFRPRMLPGIFSKPPCPLWAVWGTDVAYAKLCELRGELDRRDSSLQAVWIYLEAMGVTHGR